MLIKKNPSDCATSDKIQGFLNCFIAVIMNTFFLFSCSLLFRCYNYWFWVPLVAPLLGGVLGSFMYLIFIQLHLPDEDLPDSISTLSTISDKCKQPATTWEHGVEIKNAYF